MTILLLSGSVCCCSSWGICGIWRSYWWCPVQLGRSQLLLSNEDTMEVILQCNDSCFYAKIHESVWNWSFSYVLRGIYFSMEAF